MSQHIGPRTISAQGGSIKRVGNYRIHIFPSELVTDGLVLNLDAGDPRSYPSSGTTWTDLSGNGNNGTLINGPTYSNADGGSIVFNSTDPDLVKLNSSFVGNLDEFSVDIWVKRSASSDKYVYVESTNSGSSPFWGITSSNDAGYFGYLRVFIRNDNGTVELDWEPRDSAFNIYDNTWHNIVFVYSNNLIKFYVDGSIAGSTTWNKGPFNNLEHTAIGAIEYNGGFQSAGIDGNVSSVKRYNRALSAAEVAQNYDALRVRYGTYTNTFTPICAGGEGKVEVLCVAGGGGGGGGDVGSGGGAGGLIYNSSFSIDSNFPVSLSVGAGGQGNNVASQRGANGSNSTFSTLTAIGGGGGNGWSLTNGGSAGGSGGSGGGGRTGGSATSGQGYPGGSDNALAFPNYPQGGGGGAGGPGQDGYQLSGDGTEVAGDGGPGLQYSISGESKFYAGGGGGAIESGQNSGRPFGKGGSGVGGDGGRGVPSVVATNGIPNTGSGGGGDDSGTGVGGGNGANGTVIVRYPATDYNVEVLVVGGGGGGGKSGTIGSDPGGGGGGAGGLIYNSSYPVSSGKKLQISVGKGGRGTSVRDNPTTENGSNSIFNDLVAIGGGKGGGANSSGSNGGSGGGGGGNTGSTSLGIPGQGNNGSASNSNYGGGGGGAGLSGSLPTGGDGLAYSITGTSTYYAGGGAGGSRQGYATGIGGIGGGGNGGADANNATNGTVNTGGGGGGSSVGVSGDGGSGIVIIAYKGPQRGIGGTVDTTSRPGYTLHKFTTTGTDFFIP